jgi:ribosomal protein S18 acetylase RimI-like enzyme
MENVTIRKAALADIPAMVELLRQLFAIEEDFTFNAANHQKGLHLLINSHNRGIALVAEKNGLVIGMVTGQTNISTVEGTLALTLEDMVIDEMHRGKSVGTNLMNCVMEWAKIQGIPRMQLLADKTNESALAFYKKLGWKPTNLMCLRSYT